jgi:hypothetical protein
MIDGAFFSASSKACADVRCVVSSSSCSSSVSTSAMDADA